MTGRLGFVGFTVIGCFATACFAGPQTTASFLRLGGSAKAMAMQGAMTAAAGDVDSLFYNPAGLSALGRKQISLTQSRLPLGSDYEAIGIGIPSGMGAWGLGFTHLKSASLEERDEMGRLSGYFDQEDLSFSIGFSANIESVAGLGISLKQIKSRIGRDRGETIAGDIGVVARASGKPVWVGVSILNLGPGLNYHQKTEPLALTIAVGAAFELGSQLKGMIDLKKDHREKQTEVVSGVEYAVGSMLTLRGGYGSPLSNSNEKSDINTLQNMRGGIGLKFPSFQFDYAVTPLNDFSPVHRLTLATSF